MKASERTHYSAGAFVQEVAFDVVRFPAWWYSLGFLNVLRFWLREVRFMLERLSLRIWVRNLFTPMYGDYTRSGKIISFFLRLVVLSWRLVELVAWTAFLSMLVFAWLLLPPAIIYAIIRQFG